MQTRALGEIPGLFRVGSGDQKAGGWVWGTKYTGKAQMEVQRTLNPKVAGSSPAAGAKYFAREVVTSGK